MLLKFLEGYSLAKKPKKKSTRLYRWGLIESGGFYTVGPDTSGTRWYWGKAWGTDPVSYGVWTDHYCKLVKRRVAGPKTIYASMRVAHEVAHSRAKRRVGPDLRQRRIDFAKEVMGVTR